MNVTDMFRDPVTNHIKSYTQDGKKVRITYIKSKDGCRRYVWRIHEDGVLIYETLFDSNCYAVGCRNTSREPA